MFLFLVGVRPRVREGDARGSGTSRVAGATEQRKEIPVRTWHLHPESLGPSISKTADKPKQA